jgi:DNA-binding MarR family transcriptional regulator
MRDALPDDATLDAASPMEQVRILTAFANRFGTLPGTLATRRRRLVLSIREQAEANGQKLTWIARQIGVTPSTFSRIAREAKEAA